jgi:N-formylglutamate deformylase
MLVPRWSRYLIDLNRPPEDAPMYPGANNTGLCPTHFFSGDPLYLEGQAPDAAEIARRRDAYWLPYHDALQAELARLRAQHGHVLLFDGHSIRSRLPWLFDGKLPDLNLGTADGRSCAASLRGMLAAALQSQHAYTQVVDGRFKGGYITRRYGEPQQGVHAVQLEMCLSVYMDEAGLPAWNNQLAARVQPVLRTLLQAMLAWQPTA